MKKIVVLLSGGGSNLQAILNACIDKRIKGNVVAVISNRPNVMGLKRAEKHGCAAILLDHKLFDSRENFDEALKLKIDAFEPDLVVLAGFMRIFTEEFANHYIGKMINIHPSLLPKYPGLHTHQRALDEGDDLAGATVHFVTPELDGGPLVLQGSVPISAEDTEIDIAKRVLAVEHQLYPRAVALFCEERLTFSEGLPSFDGKPLQFPINMDNT